MDIKSKLKSRKFWLGIICVALGIIMWMSGDAENGKLIIAIGAGGYIGMEGIADVVSRVVPLITKESDAE